MLIPNKMNPQNTFFKKTLPVALKKEDYTTFLEKEMATYSSILAWRIPGTEESGGLPSMGSHRVGHD